MARPDPKDVRRVANVGGGPIGGGWSAHFLAHGYEVTTYVHDAAEEAPLRALVETAWKNLQVLGVPDGVSPDDMTCTTDLEEAVGDAEFVQESVPENLELKQELYERLGSWCRRT